MRALKSNFLVLFISLSTTVAVASADVIPLEPIAEIGSYAGQALDVKNNLAAVGQKVSGSYAVCFYEHSITGWTLTETTTIGTRRAVSVAFGNDFLGIALSGTGYAGVVLEPTKSGWQLTSELPNPDPTRFNSFSLAAASDNAIFITCNDSNEQYRDTVLVYERGAKGWQHVQTIAPWSASCTLFGQDIDASGDMLVVGATPVLGCSGGNVHGAYVYLRGTENWEYLTAIQSGDSNGKWVACDGESVVSWCSITGPNSTFDYLETWLLTGTSFQSTGSISSNNWGFDIYFPEGMQIAEGVITFGTCGGFWGCQTNTTTNRTVYTSQKIGNYWQLGIPVTIPSGYGSTGFGRNVKMGGGSLLIGAPAYSSSRGVVFQTTLAATLPCPADLNSDGVVNVSDMLHIISEWGNTGRADLNGDSIVNVSDLLWLLDSWGDC
ncbi:MAG TPA: hypothetical protein EYN11_02565 [Phycisphaerales bacterium]|nr:hypothetical protein [Phycisphaerales bacterium]HIO19956.1 hypothetical protein [Phycisphaerales bacterium]